MKNKVYLVFILVVILLIGLFSTPVTSSINVISLDINEEYKSEGNADNLYFNLNNIKLDLNNIKSIDEDVHINVNIENNQSSELIDKTYTYDITDENGFIEEKIMVNLVGDDKFNSEDFTESDATNIKIEISINHADIDKKSISNDTNIKHTQRIGSCQEVLDSNPNAESGIYTIETADGEFDTYCDMETNGGGWTLVASTTGADDSSQFHYNGGDWTGGDTGSVDYDERETIFNQYINSEPIGDVSNRKTQDTILPSYYKSSFDKMMFTDDADNYIEYDGMSGPDVSTWFRNLDGAVDPIENTDIGSCSSNDCENTIDDSFEPSSTNLDSSVNNNNRLTVRFKSEDGDTELGGSANHWKYGPAWDWERNNDVNWDEGGFGWASAAETGGDGNHISTRGLGGTKAEHNADYIFWYVR